MTGFRRHPSEPFEGVHGRARELAALRLSDALEPEDELWLEEHLAGCQPCRQVEDAYESQRLALRRLPVPEPPRDLWARTAVALDEAERRRFGGRRRRLGRDSSPAMLGTVAAAAVVVVVVGSTLLAGALRPAPAPITGPSLALASAAPTPIAVQPGRVVWASHQDDGTYALNIAPVDRVCPSTAAQACAPIDTSARKLVALTFRPKAVVLAQDRPEAVVVGPAAASLGTSVFVVSLPADSVTGSPTPSPSIIATSPSVSSATASVPGSATPKATPKATAKSTPVSSARVTPSSPESTATGEPSTGTSATPLTSEPFASSAAPSPAATIAILDNVLLAGEAAAYSPDGTWFAFSARPADGSRGPDIYLWRVGDTEARPVTSDHSSVFSAWFGDRILGSTVTAVTAASESPSPPTSEPAGNSPTASSRAPSHKPSPPPSAAAATPTQPAASGSGPETSPGPSQPGADSTLIPRSFAIDPVTGAEQTFGDGIWRPIVDPTGTLVLYWRGTLAFDPASSSWQPAQGDLYLAPWSSIAPADLLPASASPSPSQSGEPTASGSAPVSSAGSSRGHASPSTLPVPTAASRASTGPTESAAASSSAPSPSGSDSASSGSPTVSASPLAPELLAPADPPTGLGPTTWDARWDATGTHLAIWVADPVQPSLGRLSLLTVDPASARVDPSAALLVGTPALPGFSLHVDGLAWVTPPGQDGQGSQLQVLAWQGTAAGTIESLPIPDSEQLIVAR